MERATMDLDQVDLSDGGGVPECQLEELSSAIEETGFLLYKLESLDRLGLVDNLPKLANSIKAELRHFQRLSQNPSRITPASLSCTNIPYLRGVVETLLGMEDPRAVMKKMSDQVRVDVVGNGGLEWVKVRASTRRGADERRAIRYFSEEDEMEDGSVWMSCSKVPSGRKSLCESLQPWILECERHLVHYNHRPRVIVQFMTVLEEVDLDLREELEAMGVVVRGTDSYHEEGSPNIHKLPNRQQVLRYRLSSSISLATPTLFLDVSTLIALCSDLVHNPELWKPSCSSNAFYAEDQHTRTQSRDLTSLVTQITEETENTAEPGHSVLVVLTELLKGKRCVTCRTAYEKFAEISGLIGGPGEKARAAALFRQPASGSRLNAASTTPNVEIIPDDPSESIMALTLSTSASTHDGRKVRSRGPRISQHGFKKHYTTLVGTAHHHHLTFVTGNGWLQRSFGQLRGIGGEVSFWVHRPRSFCEERRTGSRGKRPHVDNIVKGV